MSLETSDRPQLYVVRNEVDPDHEYHCDALAARFPDAIEVDYPAGERVSLDDADGVVLTGSTAGVYEADRHPWIDEQKALVRELVDRQIPTLGVCFGHQIANAALGGRVEHVGTDATLVQAELDSDPLFSGIESVVVSLHGDHVTKAGAKMDVVASAEHCQIYGTRHRSAPLWTVQFHPEITASLRDRLIEDFEWHSSQYSFADVDAEGLFDNYRACVDRGDC